MNKEPAAAQRYSTHRVNSTERERQGEIEVEKARVKKTDSQGEIEVVRETGKER